MQRRVFIRVGLAVAAAYVLGTAALAFSQWYLWGDTWPVITAADVLTGWATIPRHDVQFVIMSSWNVADDPQPIATLAIWDAVCTGLVALVNVSIVVALVRLVAAIRQRRRPSSTADMDRRSAAW